MSNPNRVIAILLALFVLGWLIAAFAMLAFSPFQNETVYPEKVLENIDLGNGWKVFTIDLNPSDMTYQTILYNENTGEFTQLN